MSQDSPRGTGRGWGGRKREDSRDGSRRNARGHERNRKDQKDRKFSSFAPSQRRRVADPSRLVAFEVLQAVETEQSYANLVLPGAIRKHRLDRRDAAFATELAYGALREKGFYQAVLERCVDRPWEEIDQKIRTALLLGAHQLLGMRTPVHAALNQTVGLARGVIGAGPSSMVNAVLRRVSERTRQQWLEELLAGTDDELKKLSLQYSHPTWIVRAFRQALAAHGRAPEEIESLLAADNATPVVHILALPGVGSLEEALANEAEPAPMVQDAALYRHGDLGRLEGVRNGTVRAQDSGSQLVARALAEVPLEGSDEAWLDLCAGPGGKAALLAALADQRGAQLVANEVSEHRAELVRKSMRPFRPDTTAVITGDGRSIRENLLEADLPEPLSLAVEAFGEQGEVFDRVMVDAPCSGLGALRRRPEARWRKQPTDIPELTELQRELARAAIAVTRPGGVVAYVTCSPHAAETTAVVMDLLEEGAVELLDSGEALRQVARPGTLKGSLDAGQPLPGAEPAAGQEEATTAQLWPHVHSTDAMFLALLRKK